MADVRPYPKVGEVFELTLDGDALENQPFEIVKRNYVPKGWEYHGPKVKGRETRRFKLVEIGYCRTLDEVRRKLTVHGGIPIGQWIAAFKTVYPKHEGNWSIGIADASWKHPHGNFLFPFIDEYGELYFGITNGNYDVYWHWLVEVK